MFNLVKSLRLILFLCSATLACTQAQTSDKKSTATYGQAFRETKAIAAEKLPVVLGSQDSLAMEVVGKVESVCQAKGCWMDIRLADNSTMKVRFKDYAFFVPKDLKGKTVVLKGIAYNQSVSVEDQQHYAVDAGRSADQVSAITQPKQSITFTAHGVKVK